MYQSSVAFGNLIQQDSRTFQAQIMLGDKSITDGIKSIKVSGGSNSEDDFSFGSAVSQYVEITLATSDVTFEGHEFLLEMGVLINESVEEYIPMGYFTAEKPDSDEEQITFTAYDRMMKMERACFLELPDQTNTIAVLKAISTITGVPVVTDGLTAISMQKPVGYTCREVLSYIAQMYGGFAICNRSGQIEIKTYEDHNYKVPTGRYWDSFTHNDLPFVLQKIVCYTGRDEDGEDTSVSVGTGVRNVSFSNPFMTQAALNGIWKKLQNYTYMPGSVRFLGDPRIDPWDILTVEDRNGESYKVPAMKLTQDFDGGLSTEVEAVGKSEAEQENGFQGPNTRQMDRYYAQLVLIDHAMVNKLDADTAKITYATIENLNAVQATIQDLDVTKLTAKVATIEEAYIDRAQVNTLLAGYASITDLQATTAQVTSLSGRFATFEQTTTQEFVAAKGWMLEGAIGDAQISHVNANKIDTGTLDTALVTVAGSDGRLQIIDNTIQISDADHVRVQIGKDASGDYTLAVWDSAGKLIWDALGATENTIQRKIIRDKMVADDAAIQALKLDLKSFNTAMTQQGATISGTVVQVGNKTLNVALTEQTQRITEHGETLTDHAARITANENAIKLKVSTQEYESYKSTVSDQITTVNQSLNTTNQEISVMKGQIAMKVEQTDIDTAMKEIDAKFAAYSTTNQMQSAIDIAKNSITQSVFETYATKSQVNTVSGNVTTLTSRVSAAEQKLTKDSLVTTIGSYYATASYVGSAIEGIEIGGRNLWLNTKEYDASKYSGWVDNNEGIRLLTSKPYTTVNGFGVQRIASARSDISQRVPIEPNTMYTLSAWIKWENTIGIMCFYTNAGTMGGTNVTSQVGTNDYKRVIITFNSGNATQSTCRFECSTATAYLIYGLKLEKGTKATDWTPAPEDMDASITSAQTIATQTADKFNWLVKSGSSATDFTLTDRTATLIANAINLKGLVTFSGLDSTAQSKINTAQSTADTAKTNAATAQSTANTAKTNAATAQSTADTAKANAATAQTTANAAQTKANAADNAIAAWCYNNDRTYINGGKIYTKSIKAAQIDVNNLFAQNITATGTITGVTLKSAVINSTSGNIGGLSIADGMLSATVTKSSSEKTYLRINSKVPSIELLTEKGDLLPFSTTIDGDGITCWKGVFSTLTVNGEFKFSDYTGSSRRPISSSSTAGAKIANAGSHVSSGTYYINFSGEYGTSGTFSTKRFNSTSSDIRLKENVAPATIEALPILNKIGMYQFDWKQDHTHWDVGFVADYLEKVDSKFAIGGGYDEDGNMDEKSVNDFYLMGYVVKGIQELCAWNVRSDDRINSIDKKYQSKTASLEAKVSSLQYQLQQAFTRIAEQEKLIKQLQAAG